MLVLALILGISASAFSASWSSLNNPFKMGADFKSELLQLPNTGTLVDQRLGWPGNHWASYIGGVAHRWSAGNPQNFSYKLLSLSELQKLEPHELNELSPAEKFDIYNGNYNYPTVKNVFSRVSPFESEWHGICHGYAPAALNHPEPASVTLVNPDGLSVHFYSSDVSGLMSFYYANVAQTTATLVGSRCRYYAGSKIPRRSQESCNDMNAGAFHLILANKLGLGGVGFIADIDRYFEVWNHVAVNYQSTILGETVPDVSSASGTVKRVQIASIVTYAAAIAPKFDPVLNTEAAEYAQNTYEYYVDLNSLGQIIGGDWISEGRPDFVWTQRKALFNKEWESLNQIYSPAILRP
jgi:hypothetical protein